MKEEQKLTWKTFRKAMWKKYNKSNSYETSEVGKGAGADGAGENEKNNDMINDEAHSPKRT